MASVDASVAVTVACPNRPDQRHTGILYRSDRGPRVLQLNWHHWASCDAPANELTYPVALDSELIYLVSVACELVTSLYVEAPAAPPAIGARASPVRAVPKLRLPYGLKYAGGGFARDGTLALRGNAVGLTCATFVLAVFDYAGVLLLDVGGWPSRSEDAAWHATIVDQLGQGRRRASPEHIAAVRAEIPCARFRPEEVAAAGALYPPTAGFDACLARSAEILVALGVPIPT